VDENYLLSLLSGKDRAHLIAGCERVHLRMSEVLLQSGQTIAHAYFPFAGLVCLVGHREGRPDLEINQVGREGMIGVSAMLGVVKSAYRVVVYSPLDAWRMDVRALRLELADNASLKRILSRYFLVQFEQLSGLPGCMRFHQIGQRLARWLLMYADRTHCQGIHVTHGLLGELLGVRRVGITTAAGEMQRLGLIRYHHGELRILNRAGLQAMACGCYHDDLAIYKRAFPQQA
jgi:CRP-like cAMP-binding protein